jgi:serine/threonine-protein kinase
MEGSMVAPVRPLLPPGETFRGYAIRERLIDACQMPLQVFAAIRDGRLARVYCLEAPTGAPMSRAVFAERLHNLRRFAHERIPSILDGGLHQGLLWVGVEASEGSSLAERVFAEGPLDPLHVVMILRDAVAPLRVARDAGVLHGRLSPKYLLTTAAECRAVLEMGFDRLFGPGKEGGDVVYRAPEQLDPSRRADERADIYALGAVAYFALGAPPFEDAEGAFDPARVRRRILTEPLPPIAQVCAGCPPELDRLLRSMCAKREEDRPRSFEILEEGLTRVLAAFVAHRKGKGATGEPPAREDAEAFEVAPPAAPIEDVLVDVLKGEASSIDRASQAPPEVSSPPPTEEPPSPAPIKDPGLDGSALRSAAGAALILGCAAILASVAALFVPRRQESPIVATAPLSALMPQQTSLVEPVAPPPAAPPPILAAELPRKALPRRRQVPPSPDERSAPLPAPRISAIELRARSMRYPKEIP